MVPPPTKQSITLNKPERFLQWISSEPSFFSFEGFNLTEIWSLVALGVLARKDGEKPLCVEQQMDSPAGRFAHAVGFDDVLRGEPGVSIGERERTVKLARIRKFEDIERTSREITDLLISKDEEETALTVRYVLVELLRNVLQHSHDSLGAVVAAQKNSKQSKTMIQVAVGDAGIGIEKSLSVRHPAVTNAQIALERSLWPSISGTFDEGESGSADNAGMGLFFIAEMAKRLAGKLLIATRGATLSLRGDPKFGDKHQLQFIPAGFPGTLVAFEIPENAVVDNDGLFKIIRQTAAERTPKREIHRWLSFGPSPENAEKYKCALVQVVLEDTQKAKALSQKLRKTLFDGRAVEIDFSNVPILTQSYLHALLYEPLRLAWALKVKIYIVNASPAVRSNLELLQQYALGG